MIEPVYRDDWLTVLGGDCREVMRSLPVESIHTVVTSPPYWGLRDYGTASWEGGDPECDHVVRLDPRVESSTLGGGTATTGHQHEGFPDACGRCGAVRVEPTVWGEQASDTEHEHVWDIADGYSGHRGNRGQVPQTKWQANDTYPQASRHQQQGVTSLRAGRSNVEEQRSDNLRQITAGTCACGAWRGALGLEPTPEMYVAHMVEVFREVGRVLRDDGTVWLNIGDSYAGSRGGPNGDGTTGRHEVALRQDGRWRAQGPELKPKDLVGIPWRVAFALQADGWYLRSDIIWSKANPMPESVTDRPTKSHEYLFLLSKSPRYYFDADAVREPESGGNGGNVQAATQKWGQGSDYGPSTKTTLKTPTGSRNIRSVWTIATQPYPGAHFATFPRKLVEPCIKAGCPEGGVVLDPFAGSGTTGLVAQSLSRRAILIDLNPAYLTQAMKRNVAVPMGL